MMEETTPIQGLMPYFRGQYKCHALMKFEMEETGEIVYIPCPREPKNRYHLLCKGHHFIAIEFWGKDYFNYDWFKAYHSSIRKQYGDGKKVKHSLERDEWEKIRELALQQGITFEEHQVEVYPIKPLLEESGFWERLENEIEKDILRKIKSDNIPEERQPEYKVNRYLGKVVKYVELTYKKKSTAKKFRKLAYLEQCFYIKQYVANLWLGYWCERLSNYYRKLVLRMDEYDQDIAEYWFYVPTGAPKIEFAPSGELTPESEQELRKVVEDIVCGSLKWFAERGALKFLETEEHRKRILQELGVQIQA